MTTVVKVQAHCSDDKEVQVVVHHQDGTIVEKFTLQNGETAERYAYDSRLVTVNEVLKAR